MKRFLNAAPCVLALITPALAGFGCKTTLTDRDLGRDGGSGGGSGAASSGGGTSVDDPPLATRCETSVKAGAQLRRLTALEFQRSIEDIFPEIRPQWGGVALGTDPEGPSGFTTDARSLLVGPQSAEEISRTALDVATLVTGDGALSAILPCSTAAADRACAETFVDGYGERIYRQPLTETDRSELLTYFDSVSARSDFKTALKWTLFTMLQSPFFVYRSELGDDAGDLTPHEVATQLSYTFSGTTPTPELVARAAGGEFDDPTARVNEARQLLATESGRAVLHEFLRQWTGYDQVRGVSKDGVENFNDIREAMAQETRAFLEEVIVNAGGDVSDVLTAPYTFTDASLAAHYGFGTSGGGLAKTDRPAERGVGLLAQGAFLSATAHPAMTSPVFRGLFVFENLLCGHTLPPPGNIPAIEEAPPTNTTRERFEMAHGSGACRACHQSFEPYGFAFEHFDAAGRYRADENGFEIDTAATSVTPAGEELSFDGLEDLAMKLAANRSVTDCVSGQLSAYAYSGGGGEVCLAEEQRTALADGVYGLLEYYAQLAAAPSMTQRQR